MKCEKIEAFILEAIDSTGYDRAEPETDKEKLEFLAQTFKSEYGYNIPRYGLQGAIREWLQGLPSSIHLPFQNYIILQNAVEWGRLPANATEKQEDKLLANYWNFMAMRILSLFNRHKIEV